jgi:hypothetical protein
VLRRVDAYLDSVAEVEGDDAEEAATLAENSEDDYEWEDLGPVGLDARGFVTLDRRGAEIEPMSDDDEPFHLGFEEPGAGYVSGSQRARIFTESWVAAHLFCPACGERRIERFANNSPVADFHCPTCREAFELKSQRGRFGPRVADGAYEAKLRRLAPAASPNLALMNYDLARFAVSPPSRSSRRKPGPRQEGGTTNLTNLTNTASPSAAAAEQAASATTNCAIVGRAFVRFVRFVVRSFRLPRPRVLPGSRLSPG